MTSQHLIMTRTKLQVWFSSSTRVWKIRWRPCASRLWKREDGERGGKEVEREGAGVSRGGQTKQQQGMLHLEVTPGAICPEVLKPLIYLFILSSRPPSLFFPK
uniref:Uncharacterized protein n=1 Tax=Balaenoptera musculus TaxID=9771 RepID=A0A8C0DV70_BALMU